MEVYILMENYRYNENEIVNIYNNESDAERDMARLIDWQGKDSKTRYWIDKWNVI